MGLVYGSNTILETIRAGLVTQMNNLMTAMSGDDPKILAVYDGHEIMNPTYPSVSVGIIAVENAEDEHTGMDVSALADYRVTAEIRIHLEYENNYFDRAKCLRLMNSVNNWLEEHRTSFCLTQDYIMIENNEAGINFPESFTIGARITLILRYITSQSQA